MRIFFTIAILNLVVCASAWAQSSVAPTTQEPAKPKEYQLEPVVTGNALYPPQARERKIEGEVIAMLVVSVTGDVANVRAIKGDPALRETVEDAVREWKFKPVMIGDKATRVFVRATFNFRLSDGAQTANGVPGEIGPATETPTRVRVSSGVSTGLIVRKVNPTYPEEARRARIQGAVVLQAVIDREGAISDLQYISGPNELVESAVDAVKQWRYKPYLLMGNPVEVETQIQINFTLTPR